MSDAAETVPTANELLARTSIFPQSTPEYVCHYTTIEGARAILESRKLRATDVSYLNDASEYIYADTLISEITNEQLTDPALESLKPVIQSDPRKLGFNVFAACFCQRSDLLSQWRAYASGVTGYGLEFNWKRLVRILALQRGSDLLAGKVEYELPEQAALIKAVLQPHLERLQTSNLEAPIKELASSLADPQNLYTKTHELVQERLTAHLIQTMTGLTILRAFLKSPTFSEESEWRAVVIRDDTSASPQFRTSRGVLVPYHEFDLGPPADMPISRIIVGPGPHPKLAKASLERLLQKLDLARIRVDASPIPLTL